MAPVAEIVSQESLLVSLPKLEIRIFNTRQQQLLPLGQRIKACRGNDVYSSLKKNSYATSGGRGVRSCGWRTLNCAGQVTEIGCTQIRSEMKMTKYVLVLGSVHQ
jgi:hypothetical protein